MFFERESLKSAVRHLICCENGKSSKIPMNKTPYCVHCTDNCSCGEEKEHQFWKHISMNPTRTIEDPSEDVTLPSSVGHLFYHILSMPAGVHFKWFIHLLQEYDLLHLNLINLMEPYLTIYHCNGIKRVAMRESCSRVAIQSLKKSVETLFQTN